MVNLELLGASIYRASASPFNRKRAHPLIEIHEKRPDYSKPPFINLMIYAPISSSDHFPG
jgi:hypothetical protein